MPKEQPDFSQHEQHVRQGVPSQLVPADSGSLVAYAPAKINLNLLVGQKSADGFHTVDSIICKISFYDKITLSPRTDGLIKFSCTGIKCGSDEKNLALRSARLIHSSAGNSGANIELVKKIPTGMGLGGGSSDAAAVLMGLNRLWRLGLGIDELSRLGASLGSDVPVFLYGVSSRVTGRGEIVSPARVHPFVAILCTPDFPCPTLHVYAEFDRSPVPMGRQIDQVILEAEKPSRWRGMLENQLFDAAERVCPQLSLIRRRLAGAVGLPVLMTGSGSGLFILCDDLDQAQDYAERIPQDIAGNCRIVSQNPW